MYQRLAFVMVGLCAVARAEHGNSAGGLTFGPNPPPIVCPAIITSEDIPGCPKATKEEKAFLEQWGKAVAKVLKATPPAGSPTTPVSTPGFEQPGTPPGVDDKFKELEKAVDSPASPKQPTSSTPPKKKAAEKTLDQIYYEGLSAEDKRLFDKHKAVLEDHYNDGWGLPVRLHPAVKRIASDVDRYWPEFQKGVAARIVELEAAKAATKSLDKIGPGGQIPNPELTKSYSDELKKLYQISARILAAKNNDAREALMVESTLKRKAPVIPLWSEYLYR